MRRRCGMLLGALLVLAALVAAGCGGGGGTTSSGSEAASTTASKAPAKCSGEHVRFQLSFFPNAQHVGYLVAANRGYFKDAGLDVKMIPGGPTVNPPLQLAQGNVDIAQLDFVDFVNAVGKGAPLKYIAQTYQQDPLRYISLKSVPLSSPADLKGKTVGTQQVGESDVELRGLLHKAGLTIDDVTLKSIGFSIEDLMKKSIQVFPLQTFFHIAQLQAAGVKYPSGVNILNPNKYDAGVAAQGLAINEQYASKNPDVATCFLRASLRGWQTAIDDPRGVVNDVEKYIPKGTTTRKDNVIDVAETLKLVTTNPAGKKVQPLSIDMSYLEQSQARALQYGAIKSKENLSGIVDTTPLEQARQSAGSS